MELNVKSLDGRNVGEISVSESIFGLSPKEDLIAAVIRWQLARRRSGTHKSKSRSEISYTGSKMYAQKRTGRARHSSSRAPQFRGGGKAFGPVVIDHEYTIPRKVRSLALCHAISSKIQSEDVLIIDNLVSQEAKTKYIASFFKGLELYNALIVDGFQLNENFKLASQNIPNIDLLPAQGINVYDILRRRKLVLSISAVKALEGRLK
ncbi:LSU ribosomal protein L4p (L1e) [Liberibacter crescens BT-1]|uniref:Large ribosomal subunit protein uL4 n=1 Tax=Liberibacter crescens (strain BT-1) TaxID=1215343 RepID=L0EUR0_LIBCB|nr:50S ribosomal protein L4 [Liberibacter crescens]AGA64403.1 LSU ribosomal protein L4p (L1e) [Liberibacter crescens BT-1]AMC12586.1 50S ribosomal protein L4 [Liberibacter crescens]